MERESVTCCLRGPEMVCPEIAEEHLPAPVEIRSCLAPGFDVTSPYPLVTTRLQMEALLGPLFGRTR